VSGILVACCRGMSVLEADSRLDSEYTSGGSSYCSVSFV